MREMTLIQRWVQTPLAEAVGWTLLHLLWEGAIISAALAAGLFAMRSARARYAAACIAMLLMMGAFALTLICAMPEGTHNLEIVRPPAFRHWNVPARLRAPDPSNMGLAAPYRGSRRSGSRESAFSTWGTRSVGSRYTGCDAVAFAVSPNSGRRSFGA